MNPRPDRHGESVIQAAFVHFWPKLGKVLLSENCQKMEAMDEWKDSALKLLSDSREEDGYQLAKDFESAGWEVDAAFVEICDEWGHELYTAHQTAIKEWSIENAVVPKFSVGDIVKFYASPSPSQRKEMMAGKIIVVDSAKQIYTVFSADLGHVPPNHPIGGVIGRCIPFEELEKSK